MLERRQVSEVINEIHSIDTNVSISGSGDFRENLAPIQAVACDGSVGQQWDIITKGIHNDQAGQALIVSTLVSSDSIARSQLLV
jgi:hypothetical protein